MRRREFITLLGGAVASWPLAARAQQQPVHPLIGVLSPLSAASAARNIAGFRSGERRIRSRIRRKGVYSLTHRCPVWGQAEFLCSTRALLVLPSRPGEFHPEPLTDPDLTLSRHPARATA